jgi:glycerophosphoryl diester phosphodiesterase
MRQNRDGDGAGDGAGRRGRGSNLILLDPLARPVIAHRGNRAHAPENTVAAMLEAVALGADAVEFDLRLTRDGELVVAHDATVERTTDGYGPVHEHTAAQLRALDAGAKFSSDGGHSHPWRGRGVGVPSFDELIESLPSTLPCIIELKTADATEALRAAVRHHHIGARVLVAGFERAATRPLRGAGIALGACTADVATLTAQALLGRRARALPYQALCIPPRWHRVPVPIAALARSLRGSGTVVHVWTINDPAQAQQLWRAGVQGILSDDPAAMLAARQALN